MAIIESSSAPTEKARAWSLGIQNRRGGRGRPALTERRWTTASSSGASPLRTGITRKSFITAFGARRGMKIMPRATVIVLTMIPLWPAISRAVTVRISAIAPSSTMA